MNRYITALLLLLLAQAIATAAVFWPEPMSGEYAQRQPLLALPQSAVTQLTIGDEYDNVTELALLGDRWVLPQLGGLPANQPAVRALLGALAEGANSWPVADSAAARQRFEVADYFYQRRIELAGELGGDTVFLGTSPGFRQVHARNDNQGEIYSIGFNSFDAPAIAGQWIDPGLLQVRAPLAIVSDGYSVRRSDNRWLLGTGAAPQEQEIDALLGVLRTLQVDGVADEDIQRDLATTEAQLVMQVTSLAGDATLEVFELNNAHYILSSRYPYFFTLSDWDYDRLTGIDLGLLSD